MRTLVKKGSVDDFFERAREVAKAADSGAKIAKRAKVITLEPESFQVLLSNNRLRLLREVRKSGGTTMARLSSRLRRDRAGLSRDVKALESLGLVITTMEANPGHGRHKVVTPVTAKGERLVLQTEL